VDSDIYELDILRAALKLDSEGLKVGAVQKHLGRLGDRASVGLLKILDERSQVDPETATRFLPIIRAAFSSPQFITVREDMKPDVTFLLLEHIRRHTSEGSLKRKIDDLESFIANQTGVPSPPSKPTNQK